MYLRQSVWGHVHLVDLQILEAIPQVQFMSAWRALQVDWYPKFIRQVSAPFEEQTTCAATRIGRVCNENLQDWM